MHAVLADYIYSSGFFFHAAYEVAANGWDMVTCANHPRRRLDAWNISSASIGRHVTNPFWNRLLNGLIFGCFFRFIESRLSSNVLGEVCILRVILGNLCGRQLLEIVEKTYQLPSFNRKSNLASGCRRLSWAGPLHARTFVVVCVFHLTAVCFRIFVYLLMYLIRSSINQG